MYYSHRELGRGSWDVLSLILDINKWGSAKTTVPFFAASLVWPLVVHWWTSAKHDVLYEH